MFEGPYRVGIVASVTGPTHEQIEWTLARLRFLVTCVRHLGCDAETSVVVKVVRNYGNAPHWSSNLLRPRHVTIDSEGAPNWRPRQAQDVCDAFDLWPADEVWCLNGGGQTSQGTSPPAKVWRRGTEDEHRAHHYKLIPSWIASADLGPITRKPLKGLAKCLSNLI